MISLREYILKKELYQFSDDKVFSNQDIWKTTNFLHLQCTLHVFSHPSNLVDHEQSQRKHIVSAFDNV